MTTIGTLLIWVALSFGVTAAAAALYGRYRTPPALLTGPAICQLEANGCQVLFRTQLAALLGIPNSLLGLVLYCLVAVGLAAGWPERLLLAAATLALAMSVYLGYRLLRDRLECRVCWTGHLANTMLWLGLLLRTTERAG